MIFMTTTSDTGLFDLLVFPVQDSESDDGVACYQVFMSCPQG